MQINHGTSICYTLALASCLIAHYNGDAQNARALLQLLLEQAQKHSVLLFYRWARQYAQVLDADAAVPIATDDSGLIREIMVTLDSRFVDDALLERAHSGAAGWSTAEILRARADRMLIEQSACPDSSTRQAEKVLLQALSIAQTQGALAWELRSATSLAQLWQRQNRYREALELLNPIYQRFTEGYATPDLRKVRWLLDELGRQLRA